MCGRRGGGGCHVCIRGVRAIFLGPKFHLKDIFLGSKICNINFPIFEGKKFQQLFEIAILLGAKVSGNPYFWV